MLRVNIHLQPRCRVHYLYSARNLQFLLILGVRRAQLQQLWHCCSNRIMILIRTVAADLEDVCGGGGGCGTGGYGKSKN